MTKPATKEIAIILLVILVSICLFLLISSKRVLVWETRVEPGEIYTLPEWGDLGKAQQTQLVCRYFTGRASNSASIGTLQTTLWGKISALSC